MKNAKWLDELAEKLEQKKTAGRTKVASKVESKDLAAEADMIVIGRDKLAGAVIGNTVNYRNAGWKVVNVSYKDAIGEGVVLKRMAAIDEKKLTDAPERANTDPGNIYDYNVRETSEIPDFQAAAAATEQAIAQDATHDITTPQGRCTNVNAPAAAPAEPAAPAAEEVTPVENVVVDPAVEPAIEEVEVDEEDPFAGALDEIDEQEAAEVGEEVGEEVVEKPVEEQVEDEKKVASTKKGKRRNAFTSNTILKNIIASVKK